MRQGMTRVYSVWPCRVPRAPVVMPAPAEPVQAFAGPTPAEPGQARPSRPVGYPAEFGGGDQTPPPRGQYVGAREKMARRRPALACRVVERTRTPRGSKTHEIVRTAGLTVWGRAGGRNSHPHPGPTPRLKTCGREPAGRRMVCLVDRRKKPALGFSAGISPERVVWPAKHARRRTAIGTVVAAGSAAGVLPA